MVPIPEDIDRRDGFISLARERCKELMRGAEPRVDSRYHKPTSIAQQEVIAGLVHRRDLDAGPPSPEVVSDPEDAAEAAPPAEPEAED